MSVFLTFVMAILFTGSSFAKSERPPQFVMLSFDGSKSLSFWQESRTFAQEENVAFTYFISGVYFLATADKNNYVEPRLGAGKSAIGFGGSKQDIQPRIAQVYQAALDGHEIASHANAHYDGASYSTSMWNSEFEQFFSLITNAWKHSGVPEQEPTEWSYYINNDVVGFRAPQLGVGNGLWASMSQYGFAYDASRVDRMNYWPKKINGIWNFPLAGLTIAGTNKRTLSMDYNFYMAQSKAEPGPASKYKEYEDQMFKTYQAYFNNNYYGNRAPLHIGHHFSKWNGGAYWEALKRFATSVCTLPEVKCVTYKELVNFVETHQADINSFESGDFDKYTNAHLSLNLSSQNSRHVMKELTDVELEELRGSANDHVRAHEDVE